MQILKKTFLQQLADNLRKPGGRVPDPDPNAALGATIPMPAFTYRAKSQKRLTVACDLVRFYQTVGRNLTTANIQWNQVMSNFEIQWKALKDRKDEDDPDVPKITKGLPIIKWTEAFHNFLNRVIGVRMIPLVYVIRIDPQVPGPAPTLAPNQPHSTEHGSVEGELIARASHTHALFRDDNSLVYYHLEEATRGTSYAASIKPFQRGKDGRGAWKALTSQYAGKGKWEAEIKHQEQLLHTRIWKGLLKNSSSLSSRSPALRGSSALLTLLVSFLKIACLHVSFTASENFYKLSKMHCHLVLTLHFLILRMSEYRNPPIKHISTYTLVSSFINTYVTDLFLGSISHSKIPF